MARAKKKGQQLNTAVIYARFSSHNQREESIEQQVAECQAYAKANGLTVVGVYSDSAVSGRSDRRPEFQRLRRDAKGETFAYVIAYKSNRIARNILNALTFENEMEKLDITVVYAKEEFGNNPTGRFALRMMMNVNQFYSENLGEDIKRNQIANAKECKANGPAPYGYTTGPNGKFIIDETTAKIVQEIFQRTLDGEPFVDIARELNQRGIKTRRGGQWAVSSFASILNNERYIGTYIHGDIRVEGGMPQIITEEMFYQVKNKLENKKNPQGRHRDNGDYLLTGKLFCGHCKAPMVGMSGTSRTGTLHYYYVCNEKRLNGSCEKKNIKRDYLEFKVAEAIVKQLLNEETIQWIIDETLKFQQESKISTEADELRNKLSEVESNLKNVMAAIEAGIISDTTKARLLELEDQKAQIKSRLAITNAGLRSVSAEEIAVYLNSFKDGDIYSKDFQRNLFRNFVTAVYLYDDGKFKVVFSYDKTTDFDVDINDIEANQSEDISISNVRTNSNLGHQTKKQMQPHLFFCYYFILDNI